MFLAAAAALAAVVVPQQQQPGPPLAFPARDYQPHLVDPGLHGGRPKFTGDQDSQPGDITPDGRVIVFYRKAFDSQTMTFRSALQVAAFDPDALQTQGRNLLGFYSEGPGATVGGVTLWGSDYAISDIPNSYVLHFSPPTLPGTDPSCASCPQLDRSYLPDGSSTATLTLALRPLVGHPAKGANPFPSDAAGNYIESGSYRTYELWMVTVHFPVDPGDIGCGSGFQWGCQNGVWQWHPMGPNSMSRLGARNLTVVVDESVQPHRIQYATATPFQQLQTSSGAPVIGTEPTITADGKLLLFQSDAGNNVATAGDVTYAYNSTPCSVTGWAPPRSITAMYTLENQSFKDSYALARQPIREPDSNGVYVDLTAADVLEGPYPWVEKDGSFFMSAHTFSSEGQAGNQATRSSMILCGAITNGFVKHVDDVALNPTRSGGTFDWPLTTDPTHNGKRDTQMTTFFATGLKPGLWEPFLGAGVPVPTMQASLRIPLISVFVPRTRLEGEVRLEEADGDYLAYFACNEAFRRNTTAGWPATIDATHTPDTSGRATRVDCALQPGAAFPQEVHGSHNLRLALSPVAGLEYHENIGFKGQGILFATAGSAQLASLPAHGNELTFQAFVKAMRSWNSQLLRIVTSTGRFELRLTTGGRFVGQVTVGNGSATVTKSVKSRLDSIVGQPNEFDPSAGWRHVAVTFDGDHNGNSVLRIYVDGLLEDTLTWSGISTFQGADTDVYFGPRIAGGSTNGLDAVLVLDEVAISDVVRTEDEIRRDAFVAPLPSEFEHVWPAQADFPLPNGLSADDVQWPKGVSYLKAKVDLGRALFAHPILSGNGSVQGTTSCATCHEPAHGFAETITHALDVNGVALPFNTPSLLNAAFGTHKMFDGRALSLEDQVRLPLTSGREMGMQSMADVLLRLQGSAFDADFQAIFNASATANTLAEVLAMYERTLMTGDSAFDNGWHPGHVGQPGGGAQPSLTSSQLAGRALFFGKARCFGCHRGTSFSDDDFHNIHTVVSPEVLGRGGFTGRSSELGMLKTPTLRNIARTGPYFHDGSRSTLADVVDHYDGGFLSATGALGPLDRSLRPLGLSATEKTQLVDFLLALSGTDPQ